MITNVLPHFFMNHSVFIESVYLYYRWLTTQVGWLGLRVGGTRHLVCIHQMNRVNSRSDHGHENSTIDIVVELLLFIIIMDGCNGCVT